MPLRRSRSISTCTRRDCPAPGRPAFDAAPGRFEGWPATVELQTRFLAPAARTALAAEARVVRAGKRLAVAEVVVRTPDGGLIAAGTATFSRSEDRELHKAGPAERP